MASQAARRDILPQGTIEGAALQHRPWNSARHLSRGLAAIERFLASAGFDRAPWLAVAFGTGIVTWFVLPTPATWIAWMLGCAAVSAACAAILRAGGRFPYLRQAGLIVPLALAAGCGTVWLRSELVGAEPIAHPMVAVFTGKVLQVEIQPAQARRRITLSIRDPGTGRAMRVRLNLPDEMAAGVSLHDGAVIKVRARLVPPAAPMLPGSYNFARTAWFRGLSATGSALSAPELLDDSRRGAWISDLQKRLSHHVQQHLIGDEAGIAAVLATGDSGAIGADDVQAMRDSGLAHLLSISGLHVSAVIAATYLIALKLLALWPWLALRVRLPVMAAAFGAAAGLGYTLLTGAQVPTVRSCIGALLVLAALALGREPLSLRMLAIGAFLVMMFWPEAVIGPSFQLSFAAVLAIIALSAAGPVRAFNAPRDEGWLRRWSRHVAMLLLTGVVIEVALMPIGLYHFHRAGIYGALANILAIPLTTLIIMPSVLGALLLDVAGLGTPAWWVAGKAITALLWLAHWTASRPGAITVMPAFGGVAFALFVAGGLWLALWKGRVRWLGLAPALAGMILLLCVRPPDLLVSGDGRHVGIMSANGEALYLLRHSRSHFVQDNLLEVAGMSGDPVLLSDWPGARCNEDACIVVLRRGRRDWRVLLTRSRNAIPERSLAAACDRVEVVISDRWLPRSCQAKWLKADRHLLGQTGGLAIDLSSGKVTTVAQSEGRHGWWNASPAKKRFRSSAKPLTSPAAIMD